MNKYFYGDPKVPRRYRDSRHNTMTPRQTTTTLRQNTTILRQNTTILGQNTTTLRQNTEETYGDTQRKTCGDTQRKPAAKLRGNPRRKSNCTAEVNLHGRSEFTKSNDQRTSPLHFLSKMADRNDSTNERAILESLFYKGYEYNEIINLLKTQHNIRMNMRIRLCATRYWDGRQMYSLLRNLCPGGGGTSG